MNSKKAAVRCPSKNMTGRTYALPAHKLRSAGGHGEPLTGRLKPSSEVRFLAVVMGSPDQNALLASDTGYKFYSLLSRLFFWRICFSALSILTDKYPSDGFVFFKFSNGLIALGSPICPRALTIFSRVSV